MLPSLTIATAKKKALRSWQEVHKHLQVADRATQNAAGEAWECGAALSVVKAGLEHVGTQVTPKARCHLEKLAEAAGLTLSQILRIVISTGLEHVELVRVDVKQAA